MSKIEESVCNKIQQRAEVGKAKYGVEMTRTDLGYKDWLIHAQEEAMDFCVYLEKIIQSYSITEEKGKEILTALTISCVRSLSPEQQISLAKDLLERNELQK